MEAYLSELYYNPLKQANFTNPQKLYDAAKSEGRYNIKLKDIKDWLKSQETYTLNRRSVRPKPQNRVIVEGLDSQWDCDLGDMQSLSNIVFHSLFLSQIPRIVACPLANCLMSILMIP